MQQDAGQEAPERSKAKLPAKRRALGLAVAALIGWGLITGWAIVGTPGLFAAGSAPDLASNLRNAGGILLLLAIFGLPFAFVTTFVVGWPLWLLAERLRWDRPRHGLGWGALSGIVIAGFITAQGGAEHGSIWRMIITLAALGAVAGACAVRVANRPIRR